MAPWEYYNAKLNEFVYGNHLLGLRVAHAFLFVWVDNTSQVEELQLFCKEYPLKTINVKLILVKGFLDL